MKRIPILILIILLVATFMSPPNPNVNKVAGKFYDSFEATDINGNTDTYYQFKSNDDSVWWMLTAEEIGCIPNGNMEYVLTYDNNGTTKENKSCSCTDCECEVYDDIFVTIREM